jgi:thioredoxin 1
MANKHVMEITDVNFNSTITSGVTLVDFWAPWCSPCLMQAPILEKVAQQFDGQAQVGKINVDSNPSTAASFNVRGIPTLILFKDGQEVERLVGVQTEGTLANIIQRNLTSQANDTFIQL